MQKCNSRSSWLIGLGVIICLLVWFIRPKNVNLENQSAKVLNVGISADFPPFTYIDQGQVVGFEIDLVSEVGRRLGKEIEFKNMPFATLLPSLQTGQLQVIAAGLTATPERAKHVLFTKPYLQDNPLAIVSLANNPIKQVSELVGQEVIVNEGYTADLYLSKIDGIILKRLKTPAEAFLALKSGRAKAFVTARDTVQPFFDQNSAQDFKLALIPDTNESASLAIALHDADLLGELQNVLDQMQQDGTLKKIKDKWKLS